MTPSDGRAAFERHLPWVPAGLAAVAEAAWISVLGGVVQEFALRGPVLGLLPLVGLVAGGAALARTFGPRLGERWPSVGLAAVVAVALAGLLASPDARAVLVDGGLSALPDALVRDPGGFVAGLALMRGYALARPPLDDGHLARLLWGGLAAISAWAIVGGLVDARVRAVFMADTTAAALVFVVAAIVALALTRISQAGAGSGADWSRNPTWVASLVGVVLVLLVVAIPSAGVVGPAVEVAVALAIGPLVLVGLVAGWNRNTARLLLVVLLIAAALLVIVPLLGTAAETATPPIGAPGQPTSNPTVADRPVVIVSLGFLGILGVVALLALIRVWMRTPEAGDDSGLDTRTIDRGIDTGPRPPRRIGLPFGGPKPGNAVAAYRALMADLANRPGVRRAPTETPAEHAHRLRGEGNGSLGLELLAADYALARFGGVALSATEDRRAVGRWRRLRRSLHPAPSGPSDPQARPAFEEELTIHTLRSDKLVALRGAPNEREA